MKPVFLIEHLTKKRCCRIIWNDCLKPSTFNCAPRFSSKKRKPKSYNVVDMKDVDLMFARFTFWNDCLKPSTFNCAPRFSSKKRKPKSYNVVDMKDVDLMFARFTFWNDCLKPSTFNCAPRFSSKKRKPKSYNVVDMKDVDLIFARFTFKPLFQLPRFPLRPNRNRKETQQFSVNKKISSV